MTRERYLSDAELAAFMDAVRSRRHKHQPRDYAMFTLLANTGLRPAEVSSLVVSDLHLSARQPWIRLHRPKPGAGPLPINELVVHREVARVVLAYTSTLQPQTQPWKFSSRRQVARLFRYYLARAGITHAYKVYSLRHSVGMRLWRATRDLRLIQGLLGHSHVSGAACYVHTSPLQLVDAYQCAGAIG